MKKSLIISSLMLKMWKKEIRKLLDTKMKVFIASVFTLSIISIAVFGGYQITSVSLQGFLNGDTRSITLLTVSMYLNASILTFVFFIFFKAMASDQDRLSIQLSWFPVNLFEKNLGYFIPFSSVILSLVFCMISIIMVPAFFTQKAGFIFSCAFLFGLLLQSFFVLCLMQFIYNISTFLVKICKLPFGKLLTLLLVILVCLIYGLESLSIKGMLNTFTVFDYNVTYFASPIFLGVIGELAYMKVNIPIIIIGYIGVILLSFFSLFLINIKSEKRSLKLFRFLPIPQNKLGALIVKEVKSQCRNEENLLNSILIIILVILFKLKFNFQDNSVIIIALAGITGIIALNSFGNDKKMYLAYKTYNITSLKVLTGKFIGLCILSLIQLVIFCLLLLYTPDTFKESFQIILIVINSIAAFYLAGTIIPLDKNNPYAGILAFIFILCSLIPIVFIGNQIIGQTNEVLKFGSIILAEILLGIIIALTNRWRLKNE
ncbi:hypothetical protein [Bacillus pseudomycoides]|uniref:hypothetical protein n=1 Tax=Bacillus pseudomycoides TaxID=64104 RepID=UPI002FFEB374